MSYWWALAGADPSRPQTTPPPPGPDRYGRRGDADAFDKYGQERGRGFDDRGRGDFPREGRGGAEPVPGDRDSRGRRIEPFDQRGPPAGVGRDRSFDRQDPGRAPGQL
jgi:hypothetical protein